jgi:integrase
MIAQSIFYASEVPVSVPGYGYTFHSFQGNPGTVRPQGQGIPIGEAIVQLKVAKRASNRRPCYIRELNRVLVQFARGNEGQPLESVTAEQIEAFLASKNFCPAARKGTIGRISALMEFGIRKRWVKFNVTRQIEKSILEWKTPTIFTPEQVEKLMRTCQRDKPNRVAYLALVLFGGLRPTEARQIRWENVANGMITVEANITKVRMRRIVNLEPAAVAWLGWAQKNGAKLPLSESLRQIWNKDFRKILGWDRWPQDSPRHTCISYWLMLRQSAEFVAMQCGNSSKICHRHYKSLVTQQAAEKFWAIMP